MTITLKEYQPHLLQVQTNFEQVGEKQFLCVIPEADNINHVVVFLTGSVPFPDGLGGSGQEEWSGKVSFYNCLYF